MRPLGSGWGNPHQSATVGDALGGCAVIRRRSRTIRTAVCLLLTVALVPILPAEAFAFGGESHKHAAWEATALFMPFMRDEISPDEALIERSPKYPLFPALENDSVFWQEGWEEGVSGETGEDVGQTTMSNRYWIWYGAKREDDYDSEYSYAECWSRTVAHFWELDDGVYHTTGSGNYNAWMKAQEMWDHSIDFWEAGDEGKAYFYLGKVVHLVTDMGQPAHPHGDLHPGGVLDDDSLEEWSGKDDAEKFSWFVADKTSPGEVIWPKGSEEILADLNAHPEVWGDEGTSYGHNDCPNGTFYDGLPFSYDWYNVKPLFYLMSYVNQTADFLPSDSFEGDTLDYLGWVDFSQLDPALQFLDLSDNDAGCDLDDGRDHSTCKSDQCNADGDLQAVYTAGYTTAMRAVPGVIDAWRRTVDSHDPSSTVELTRTDGKPLAEWNNSPVTVHMTSAVDEESKFRASGVWKIYGELDGAASAALDETPSWGVTAEGEHTLACMTVDNFGNVESHSIDVAIDMTPPAVTFPSLRPNYLTSEDLTVSWEATDALSGVASEVAYLDNHVIDKNTVVDLSDKAGRHTLRVIAYDNAGNYTDTTYDFEVWIHATATTKPATLNSKSNGNAMFVEVQFPAPYDVGDIDLTTARLSVRGSIDLTSAFPVIEPSARLIGDLLGGVSNGGGLPSRGIRFDKEAFATALEGQTGDIHSVVWGSLSTEGAPRYLAPVTANVFTAPK